MFNNNICLDDLDDDAGKLSKAQAECMFKTKTLCLLRKSSLTSASLLLAF